MVTIGLDELRNAYEFVTFGGGNENRAYVSLDTGEIHEISDLDDEDHEVPDDLETSDRYVMVPGKHELDLGKRLVLRFAAEVLPESYQRIDGFFHGPGAYARFKDLLEAQGALERWYDYEAAATDQALREWCEEVGIELSEATTRSGPREAP